MPPLIDSHYAIFDYAMPLTLPCCHAALIHISIPFSPLVATAAFIDDAVLRC